MSGDWNKVYRGELDITIPTPKDGTHVYNKSTFEMCKICMKKFENFIKAMKQTGGRV